MEVISISVLHIGQEARYALITEDKLISRRPLLSRIVSYTVGVQAGTMANLRGVLWLKRVRDLRSGGVYRLLIFTPARLHTLLAPFLTFPLCPIRCINRSMNVSGTCMQQLICTIEHYARRVCKIVFYIFIGHIGSRKYIK